MGGKRITKKKASSNQSWAKEEREERGGYVRHRTWLGQNPLHKYSKPSSKVRLRKQITPCHPKSWYLMREEKRKGVRAR